MTLRDLQGIKSLLKSILDNQISFNEQLTTLQAGHETKNKETKSELEAMRKELQEVNSSITTDIDKIKVDITSLQNNLAVNKASKEKAQKEEMVKESKKRRSKAVRQNNKKVKANKKERGVEPVSRKVTVVLCCAHL